jgi:type VI secretion system protein ImpB
LDPRFQCSLFPVSLPWVGSALKPNGSRTVVCVLQVVAGYRNGILSCSSVVHHNQSKEGIMARQSAQHKLDRVRPPRVQITYDVEIGGAIELKELPFVVGVLGDFTGNPEQPLPKLKERKFVEVNPDNFDTVLEGMKPHLSFSVENKLSDEPDAAQLKVDLKFRKMDDFEPGNVAKQVKPLKQMLDLRTRLADLRGSLQGNDKLEELLLEAVGNTEKLDKLKTEIGGSNG